MPAESSRQQSDKGCARRGFQLTTNHLRAERSAMQLAFKPRFLEGTSSSVSSADTNIVQPAPHELNHMFTALCGFSLGPHLSFGPSVVPLGRKCRGHNLRRHCYGVDHRGLPSHLPTPGISRALNCQVRKPPSSVFATTHYRYTEFTPSVYISRRRVRW